MLRLLDTAAPLSRHQYRPGHFTASALVLAPERDALLLVRHRKLGKWLQPGGHVEPTDADLPAAARREAAEETGVADLAPEREGLFDVDVHRIPPLGGEPAHLHFDLRFLFVAGGCRLRGGFADAAWVPLGELRGDESLIRAVRKLR